MLYHNVDISNLSVVVQYEILNTTWGYPQKFLGYLIALSSENRVKCRSQQETFQFKKVILVNLDY